MNEFRLQKSEPSVFLLLIVLAIGGFLGVGVVASFMGI